MSTSHDFSHTIYCYCYCWKKWKKKTCNFTQKWLDHLLLMTSYIVTIETDHHWTWLKMCARDKRTATENARCWCFTLWEKTRKNLRGVTFTLSPFVRPRVKLNIEAGCTYFYRLRNAFLTGYLQIAGLLNQ